MYVCMCVCGGGVVLNNMCMHNPQHPVFISMCLSNLSDITAINQNLPLHKNVKIEK